MVKRRPAMVAELLTDLFGLKIPPWDHAADGPIEVSDIKPVQVRADAVPVFSRGKKDVLAVVCEVQLYKNANKRRAWAHYLTGLHKQLKCPTMLLVISPSRSVARWSTKPIEVGHPGWVLHPLVLGPDRVPVITDPDEATHAPELTVLSAMAHGAGPERKQIFRSMVHALRDVDQERFELYTDVVLRELPEVARHALEAMMDVATYEFKSDYWRGKLDKARAEARAVERAAVLLEVLADRGIELPDDTRRRITDCTDLDQLKTWTHRAANAESIDDLFD